MICLSSLHLSTNLTVDAWCLFLFFLSSFASRVFWINLIAFLLIWFIFSHAESLFLCSSTLHCTFSLSATFDDLAGLLSVLWRGCAQLIHLLFSLKLFRSKSDGTWRPMTPPDQTASVIGLNLFHSTTIHSAQLLESSILSFFSKRNFLFVQTEFSFCPNWLLLFL